MFFLAIAIALCFLILLILCVRIPDDKPTHQILKIEQPSANFHRAGDVRRFILFNSVKYSDVFLTFIEDNTYDFKSLFPEECLDNIPTEFAFYLLFVGEHDSFRLRIFFIALLGIIGLVIYGGNIILMIRLYPEETHILGIIAEILNFFSIILGALYNISPYINQLQKDNSNGN